MVTCTYLCANNKSDMSFSKYLTLLGFLSILIACGNEPKSSAAETPNNPEAVVRQWQTLMDKNDIAQAKLLSSSNTQKWLEGIDAAFGGDTLHVKTEFVSMNCEETGDKAMCKCTSKQNDLNDVYEDVFYLVKENGKWLVDLDLSENAEDGLLPIVKDSTSQE
jgi:hypothetical protein